MDIHTSPPPPVERTRPIRMHGPRLREWTTMPVSVQHRISHRVLPLSLTMSASFIATAEQSCVRSSRMMQSTIRQAENGPRQKTRSGLRFALC